MNHDVYLGLYLVLSVNGGKYELYLRFTYLPPLSLKIKPHQTSEAPARLRDSALCWMFLSLSLSLGFLYSRLLLRCRSIYVKQTEA